MTKQKLGCFEIYVAVVALVLFGTHISQQVLVELLGTVTVEAAVQAEQNETPIGENMLILRENVWNYESRC